MCGCSIFEATVAILVFANALGTIALSVDLRYHEH